MSNASIEPPNHGFNGSMMTVGFRWLRHPLGETLPAGRRSRNPFHHLFGAN
jgi:hypothetical protein